MVAEVVLQNFRGPDCSMTAYPQVALSRGAAKADEYPTKQTRADDGSDHLINLGHNPDGPEDGPLGHFFLYTTQLDINAEPCPKDRLIEPLQLNVYLDGIGEFFVSAGPDQGPPISACDGRLGVTAVTQKR
jgi:hypothetical protein